MSVRRSVIQVLLAVVLVAAGGIAWTDLVAAAGKEINATLDAAKCDSKWGPPCFTPSNGTVTQITQGETVTWRALDGTHTVTPVDSSAFTGSGDLGPDATFSVTFDKVGVFSFYCRHHGSVEDGGKTHHGMWGKIDVKPGDNTTTTTAPPPPPENPPPPPPPSNPDPGPPAPPPTKPPSPPPTSSPPPTHSNGSTGGSGGNGQGGSGRSAAELGRPWVGPPPTQAAPPPTRTASAGPPPTEPPNKAKEKEKEKERETSSDSTSPPEATAVPPDEAVLPPSPQFPTATTAPLAENPADVPHGDTIAVLKNEPGGRKRKLVLFGTIFGVGAFLAGVGGWKYLNRPSKYWPA